MHRLGYNLEHDITLLQKVQSALVGRVQTLVVELTGHDVTIGLVEQDLGAVVGYMTQFDGRIDSSLQIVDDRRLAARYITLDGYLQNELIHSLIWIDRGNHTLTLRFFWFIWPSWIKYLSKLSLKIEDRIYTSVMINKTGQATCIWIKWQVKTRTGWCGCFFLATGSCLGESSSRRGTRF